MQSLTKAGIKKHVVTGLEDTSTSPFPPPIKGKECRDAVLLSSEVLQHWVAAPGDKLPPA